MNFHMCFVVNDFLEIFRKIFHNSFLKNTAGQTLLISSDYSFKISRTLFNTLTPGSYKRSYMLKEIFNKDFQVCLSYYALLLPQALKC